MDAAGDVVGAAGAITTSPAAAMEAGDTGGEQHQERLDGHALEGAGKGVTLSTPPPPTYRHNRSDGARSGVSHRPPAFPTTGATAAHAPPPG